MCTSEFLVVMFSLFGQTELSVGKSSGLLFLAAQNLIAVYALAWLFRDFVCPLIF